MKRTLQQNLLVILLAAIGAAMLRLSAISGQLPLFAIPWLGIGTGLLLCVLCGTFAGRTSGLAQVLLHGVVGVGVLWANLFTVVTTYFDVWQAMSDSPPEAYADGAQLVAVVFAGWLPGLLVFLYTFATIRLLGRSFRDD